MTDGIQKKYAIIINGDDADRHLANVDRAVASLKSAGDYQINVVSPTHPKETDVNYLPATAQALDQVVEGLGSMDDDDLLVVYVTGHGDEGEHSEGSIVLSDGPFSLEKLGTNLNQLSYGRRLLFMDQCYGANGIDQFANPKTSILTAGSKGEAVQCSRFSSSFWNLNIPDTYNDGVITIQERYDYAAVQDPLFASVSQYLNPTDEISLSGQSVDGQWPKEVKEVSSRSELEAETSQLRHGQLALVTFSADWCGACHAFAPKFEQLAEKYNGRYQMLRLEGHKGSEKEWSRYYQLEGLPSVAFIDSDGKVTNVPLELRSDPEQYLAEAVTKTDEDEVAAFSRKILYGDAEKRKKAMYTIDQNFLESLNDRSTLLVGPLVSCLHDSNPQIQSAALSALGKFGDQAAPAWSDIVSCLSSEDHHVRGNAIDTLGAIPQEATQSIPIILKQAQDENMYVRYSVASALENLGDIANAVMILCDLTKDKEAQGMTLEIQIYSALALSFIDPKNRKALSAVKHVIQNTQPSAEQVQLAKALYRMGDNHAAIHYLRKNLQVNDEMIRENVLQVVDTMEAKAAPLTSEIITLTYSSNPGLVMGALQALKSIGPDAKEATPRLKELSKQETIIGQFAQQALEQIQISPQ